ncbi:type VI secretion system tube protein Hcp [Leifsonia sp. YIM 134122]|uniref:Type VI secretion system tube protein Hcp n=1 Tax=Leifsonia stereocauli TaxID=3134136 RepID=A0ABU9W735_9MICO
MTSPMFLQLTGITGESADVEHVDEIDVLSWSWGASNSGGGGFGGGGGGAGRAGKVTLQDFHFTHHVDAASAGLLLACATGKHIPDAVFAVRRPGESPAQYVVLRFKNVTVSSVLADGTAADDAFVESVGLDYGALSFEYSRQLPDGSLAPASVFQWDVAANREGF